MTGVFGSWQVALLLAISFFLTTYIITKLRIARSLLWERQKKGLVRSFLSIMIPTQLITLSPWLQGTPFSLGIYSTSNP